MHIYIYIHMCLCAYIHIYVYIYIYSHICRVKDVTGKVTGRAFSRRIPAGTVALLHGNLDTVPFK